MIILVYFYDVHQGLVGLPKGVGGLASLFFIFFVFILYYFI
jgi:hypothetical protein